MPPAIAIASKRSKATTLTDWAELVVVSLPVPAHSVVWALMFAPEPMYAWVTTVRIDTATPPATPTEPAPMAGAIPKKSSLVVAWTATPRYVPIVVSAPFESTLRTVLERAVP